MRPEINKPNVDLIGEDKVKFRFWLMAKVDIDEWNRRVGYGIRAESAERWPDHVELFLAG